jgi:hypothetical protein
MAAHEAPITRWCVRKRGRPQRRLTVMRSSPHAVAPVLQQWWQHWRSTGAALAYWQHGHDPCRLPHHSRPPTASIGAEDRQEGLGAGYPQPGAGRHAAMCIS